MSSWDQRRWTWTGDFKCREVKTGFCRNISMQTGSSGALIGWKSGQTTFVPLWDWMEGAWLRTQANRRQKRGLVWRIRTKISQIIKDYFCLPFFLLIILWAAPTVSAFKLNTTPQLHIIVYIIVKSPHRRRIRLIEGNAKCRHLKKLTCKGTCGRCLSVWGPEPHNHHPYTLYTCISTVYLFTQGGGRVEPERRGEGQQGRVPITKLGWKYKLGWM